MLAKGVRMKTRLFWAAFFTAAQATPETQREKQAHHHGAIARISVDRLERDCGRAQAR
jgi:hypothetical protein